MIKPPVIELRHVCKSYAEAGQPRVVLNDVNGSFQRGKLSVIKGRSGSGKSTLLNLLAGIDVPDSGDITLNGELITRMSEHDRTLFRRRHAGFVFQSYNLVSTLTVEENLLLPLELNGITGALARSRTQELLERFMLSERGRSFPDQLSGGEQQRVAIARGIIHQPTIVFADEPTGNLDLQAERLVLKIMQKLSSDHDITVVCATHSNEITGIADRVYELDAGTLTDR